MQSFNQSRAEHDFQWAQTRALVSRLAHIFNPGEEELLPFEEARRLASSGAEHYAGLTTVPLDKIVGSEGRYRDFNRHFLPRRQHLRKRWTSVDEARYQDINLPPVRLYEMGGVYFVRDGNHRVSVAKAAGQLEIDAEVSSLGSKLSLRPDMSIDELKSEVIAYEKREFYAATGYPAVVGADDLDFSEPGRYDTIREHVEVHKYYLNEHEKTEIPWPSALYSWHENVYSPIVLAVEEERLLQLFPGRTSGDLYLYLVSLWDKLKREGGGEVGIGEAARRLRAERARKTGIRFPARLAGAFLDFLKKLTKI